jgi:hypothetical protein
MDSFTCTHQNYEIFRKNNKRGTLGTQIFYYYCRSIRRAQYILEWYLHVGLRQAYFWYFYVLVRTWLGELDF